MVMILDLPWFPRDVQPNRRVHWTKKHRAVKLCREAGYYVSKAYGPLFEVDKLDVTITFFPPDNRRRDLDNMLSSAKAYCDGISDSLEVDDSKWAISIRRGEVVKGGSVRFEIEVPA